MPLGLVGGVIGGLAGLFGGKKQQTVNTNQNTNQTFNQQQNQTQAQNTQSTTTPNLSPLQQAISQQFLPTITQELNNANNTAGLTQSGLQNINQTNAAQTTAIKNALASRGLSYSPMAANAQVQQQLNVGNQQNQYLAQLPLLQQQLRQQALQSATGAFSVLPTGSTTAGSGTATASGTSSGTGTSTSSGTQTTAGNPVAGGISGFGSGLFGGMGLSNILNMFGPSRPSGDSGYGTNGLYGG